MLQSRGTKRHLMVAAALLVAAGGGAIITHTPLTMSQGFEKALNTSRGELTFKPQHENRPGDEGYWLTRAEVQSPALFAKPVAVGDRITISGSDGQERRLEVVDVKAMGATPAGRDTASLLLVTARIHDEKAEKSTVRFIVEGQVAKPAPKVEPKAL
jgi:hypothetical protein